MANYFYKVNPKVAQTLGLTPRDRFTFRNGCYLLWAPDMKQLDRSAFLLDRASLLARIGAVELTDPQAAQEQRDQRIELPMATDPSFAWEPETEAPEEGEAEEETESEEGGGQ